MRRDDFGMRVDEIRKLATEYSKPDLARMVQMGMIEPQKALMAGMMIDRIAKSAMRPPQSTVAQEVFGIQPGGTGTMAGTSLGAQGQDLGPTAPPAEAPPALAARGGLMGILPYSDGVAALPSGLHNMAGGGIVAFADGGDIPGYAAGVLTNSSQPQPTYLPDNMDFEKGAVPVYRAKAPEQIDLAKSAAMRTEAEQQAGLDPKLYENLRKDVLADKEDFAKQRDEAKGLAILRTGLGLMGARKGQEFQTLSAASQQALSEYGAALKDIKASEREMKKSLRDLSLAEAAYKKSNADKDLARVEAAKDRLQAHEENLAKALNEGVNRKVDLFKTQKQAETSRYVADTSAAASRYAAKTSAESHERIAGMPGAEQKLLQTIHDEEVRRNPENPPTLADTYERMRTTVGKAEARAKYAVVLEKEWNDINSDITGVSLNKLKEQYPNVKTGDDYIRHKMALFDQYYGRPKAAGAPSDAAGAGAPRATTGGVVVQTPQGAVRFNTQAEADAFKNKFGLR